MTDTNTKDHALTGDPTTIAGEDAYLIPLSGQAGTGNNAIVDPEGLQRLREAGARFLYTIGNGANQHYVAFLKIPTKKVQIAARVILDAPKGRRVIYRNGNSFDLRSANLRIQPQAGEKFSPTGETRDQINAAWQAHRAWRAREERFWKRNPQTDRRPW